jgi:KDO2-lipid IV(A) lauroyltransferase
MNKIIKALSRVFEALGFVVVIGSFHLMPIRWSSRCGAFLAGTLGPFVLPSKRAKERLKRALPGLSDFEYDRIIKDMWRNIGSTFAEYPRLKKVPLFKHDSPVEVVGLEHVDLAIEAHKPIIFVLGHLANWELATRVLSARGLPIAQVYRRVNNPLIARLVRHIHGSMVSELVEKGAGGARQLIEVMKRREALSVLIDQKMNEGVAVPFFGRDAMTAPGVAKLSLKFDAPIIPVRVERLANFRFRVTYYPPLKAARGSHNDVVYDLLLQINQHLESWIKERPEQWFWIHNRWPKEERREDS